MDNINKIENTLKTGVLNNKAYKLTPIDCPIKLNQNESPFDLSESIKNKITSQLIKKNWNVYPDFTPDNIYEKISSYLNMEKENILIGNGSNEMIFTILAATVEKGKKVIICEPTFTIYKLISSNLNANIKIIPLNNDFTYNKEELINEAQEDGSITIIASPNSPTGSSINADSIYEIVKLSKGLVIIDEAYIHFGGETVIELINNVPNLIILRTFSKAFGLPALRIGMMISNPILIKHLSKVKLPYNLNIFTLAALEVVFDNIEMVNKNIKNILKNKIKLEKDLYQIKQLKYFPSQANFFLVKVDDSKWLFNKLLEEGILVRDVSSYPKLDNCLRITVGSSEENKTLINALNKIYKN